MGKLSIGCVIAICIGCACRWYDIPLPSPTRLQGALLVVAMTFGYFGTDWAIARIRPSRGQAVNAPLCGGPTGLTREATTPQSLQQR